MNHLVAKLLIFIIAGVAVADPLYGTEVYFSQEEMHGKFVLQSQIHIQGKIGSGDYEKLLQLITTKGYNDTIFITSPSGDVHEAMKIGDLLRNGDIHVSVIDAPFADLLAVNAKRAHTAERPAAEAS